MEDDTVETQREIATVLGCSPPTVSNHLKIFSELPIPMVDRPGPSITQAGHQILGHLNEYMAELGTDLDDIDWSHPDDMDKIDECLDPLHTSRGPLLSLVIYSIGVRNSAGETLNLLHAPEPVRISPVVADVKERQQRRGETVSRDQIRWRLTNLEKGGCITIDDKTILITEKGEAQARFLKRLVELLEPGNGSEQSYSESNSNKLTSSSDISSDGEMPVNFEIKSDAVSFVPEYQLEDNATFALKKSMSVDEFVEVAAQLRQQYQGDEQMQLNWILREQDDNLENHKLLE